MLNPDEAWTATALAISEIERKLTTNPPASTADALKSAKSSLLDVLDQLALDAYQQAAASVQSASAALAALMGGVQTDPLAAALSRAASALPTVHAVAPPAGAVVPAGATEGATTSPATLTAGVAPNSVATAVASAASNPRSSDSNSTANVINRDFFYSHIRSTLFLGKLSQNQVDGLNFLLDYWITNHAYWDDRWLAYILATAFHETAHTMQPIKEYGSDAYFRSRYDIEGGNPRLARTLGNLSPGDGVKYAGRGFVQITGKTNYVDWTRRLEMPGVDLVGDPDKAMLPSVAAPILFDGMNEGSFTSKKLSDFFAGPNSDWVGARRIINGTDRAQMIGDYAQKFYASISYTV